MKTPTVTYHTLDDIIFLVIDKKPCTDAEKNVFDAAKNGDIHKLKRFIKMDGTLVDSRDEYNNTALIIASEFGQNETIDLSIGCCVT